MITYKLVMPEHMNQYGFLFGGNLLKWVDETAWMAASLDYPEARLVTIGMDRVEFRKGVTGGTILRFEINRHRVGNTSVTYAVNVSRPEAHQGHDEIIFSTEITFVRVNEQCEKVPVEL